MDGNLGQKHWNGTQQNRILKENENLEKNSLKVDEIPNQVTQTDENSTRRHDKYLQTMTHPVGYNRQLM